MNIRRAEAKDRERILEISSQIWEGEDYIHWVIDDWYAQVEGEFAVAEIDDRVVAFSLRSWLFPGYAWLQGIRTDPAFQGQGVGRAITEHFLEGARQEGADRVGLSTYIENEASIHIIESYGFRRVASYIYAETDREKPCGKPSPDLPIEAISVEEARTFVASSIYLRTCHGILPSVWKMYPFEDAWTVFASRVTDWRGIREGSRLRSLVGIDPPEDAEDAGWVAFADGDPHAIVALIQRAAADLRPTYFEWMLPKGEQDSTTDEIPAVAAARALGVKTWNDFAADSYAYELRL